MKQKVKLFIFSIITLLCYTNGSAQYRESVLEKVGNINDEVWNDSKMNSLYNGIYTESIFITGLDNINLSINYSTEPIKVDQEGGDLGFGWNLNSRTWEVKRLMKIGADEQGVHNEGEYRNIMNNIHYDDYWCSAGIVDGVSNYAKSVGDPCIEYVPLVQNNTDTEPDLFLISSPFFQIKCYIDLTGKVVTENLNGFKISYTKQNNNIISWTVIDEFGNVYEFGGTNNLEEFNIVYYHYTNEKPYDIDLAYAFSTFNNNDIFKRKVEEMRREQVNMTWKITSIKSVDGNSTNFNYTSGLKHSTLTLNELRQFIECDAGCDDSDVYRIFKTKYQNLRPLYLQEISSKQGKIVLDYVNREDKVNAKRINTIELLNNSGDQIDLIKFNFTRYISNSNLNIARYSEYTKRLYLTNVTHRNELEYSFDYYTPAELPPIYSPYIDHFGYSNLQRDGNGNEIIRKSRLVEHKLEEYGNVNFGGDAERAPNLESAVSGLLKSIKYNNSQVKEFDYQNFFNSSNEEQPGIAIKSISVKDSTLGIVKSKVNFEFEQLNEEITPTYKQSKVTTFVPMGPKNLAKTSSSDTKIKSNLEGFPLKFKSVIVSNSGYGSKKIFFDNSYLDHENTPTKFYIPLQFGDVLSTENDILLNENLGVFHTYKNIKPWETGNIIETQLLDEAGIIKQIKRFNYVNYEYDSLRGLDYEWSFHNTSAINCSLHNYYHSINYDRVLTTSTFDDFGNAQNIITKTQKNEHGLVSKTISYLDLSPNEIEEKNVTVTVYPTESYFDFNFMAYARSFKDSCYSDCTDDECAFQCDETYHDLVNSGPQNPFTKALLLAKQYNMVGLPIEERQIVELPGTSILQKSKITLYRVHGYNEEFILPSEVWELKAPVDHDQYIANNQYAHIDENGDLTFDKSKYKLVHVFNKYDQITGNLLKETFVNGESKEYEWGYNNTEIINENVSYGNSIWNNKFTYKPLVGALSITDPNNRTTSFSYNNNNKLEIKRNHNSEIIERYKYHLKGEDESYIVDFHTPNSLLNPGEVINFKFNGSLPKFGATKFVWNFGDGTEFETYQENTTHTYLNAGTYNVSLTLENQDYEDKSVSKSISLTEDPISSTICVEGYDYINNCYSHLNKVLGIACSVPLNPYRTTYRASINSGSVCNSSYTYRWEYKLKTNSFWIAQNSGQLSYDFPIERLGTYNIRFVISDGCEEYYSNIAEITITNDGCSGGGPGGLEPLGF